MFEKCRFKEYALFNIFCVFSLALTVIISYLWRHRLKDLILLDGAEQARRLEEAKLREQNKMAAAAGGGGHH